MDATEIRIAIDSHADVATAGQKGRCLAAEMNFSSAEAILIAAIASELAHNVATHGVRGEIRLKVIFGVAAPSGIQLVARAEAPGIADAVTVMKRPRAEALAVVGAQQG